MLGSKTSLVESGVEPSDVPPATNTLPLGSSWAVARARATNMFATARQVFSAG